MSSAMAPSRLHGQTAGTLGGLEFDHRRRRASVEGAELYLSEGEFKLLVALANDPDRVLTYEDLRGGTFAGAPGVSRRTIDSYAARLRRKLELRGMPGLIASLQGVGFCFGEEIAPDEPEA